MPKEAYIEEIHQDYPDPMPSHEARMAAFELLLLQNPEILTERMVEEDREVRSMPSIYEAVKGLNNRERKSNTRKKIFTKMEKIHEKPGEKEKGLATLEALNLPRYRKVKTTIAEFLEDPDSFLQKLPAHNYFPSVTNRETGERYFDLNLDRKKLLKFLREMLRTKKVQKKDLLILSEYQENAYSGNIIINPPTAADKSSSEKITIELVEGVHAGLAYEGSLPLLRSKDNWFNRLEFEVFVPAGLSEAVMQALSKVASLAKNGYVDFRQFSTACSIEEASAEDRVKLAYYEKLIRVLSQVLEKIPKDVDRDYHFSTNGLAHHPGYYEFILNKDLQVYFLDYRGAERYSDLQANLLENEESN